MRITLFYEPGELEFKWQAQKKGYELEYVGDDPDYWHRDIDFISNGNQYIEVKWDSKIHKTGNLFIEIANPRSREGLGWYRFIQADMLAYGDSKTETFYMIKVQDLKDYVEAHELPTKTTNDGATGYLLPLEDIVDITNIL